MSPIYSVARPPRSSPEILFLGWNSSRRLCRERRLDRSTAFPRHGSKRRDVEEFYRPHRGADGSVLGVVVLLTDITERKRMARQLADQARSMRRANEELEQFAYVASHDLKAPLRAIENLVAWIEEDLVSVLTADTR